MTYYPRNSTLFFTAGQYNWIAPPGVKYINLTLIGGGAGGGGGGGGGGGNSYYATGGGGGASGPVGNSGDLITFRALKVVPNQTYVINVGAAGAGGAGGSGGAPSFTPATSSDGNFGLAGTNGGDSSFTFPNGFSYIAYGGIATSNQAGPGGGCDFFPGNQGNSTGDPGSQYGSFGGNTSSGSLINYAAPPNNLYNIYTDIDLSPSSETFAISGPMDLSTVGNFLACLTNYCQDEGTRTFSYNMQAAGIAFTSFSDYLNVGMGGPGGIIQLNNSLPLYMPGVDITQFTNGTILFPGLYSNNGIGLGNGDSNTGSPGTTPQSSYICFWSNGNATKLGYGAGGIGGPGGGGGYGLNSNFETTTATAGGNGYQGDQGLPGVVMIEWT